MADPVARDQASILYEPEEMIAASIAARTRLISEVLSPSPGHHGCR